MPRRRIAIAAIALLAATVLVFSAAARATHDPDHRFFVKGRITDQMGAPACGVTVRASDVTAAAAGANVTGVTDYDGRYRILLHLHSAASGEPTHNEGDTIRVTVEPFGTSQPTTAVRSPSSEGWGEATVDVQIPQRVPAECQNPFLAIALYGGLAAALVVVAAVGYRALRSRTPRRRAGVEDIPGVGHAKAAQLRAAGFGSIERLARASPKEVASAAGIPTGEAKRLVRKADELLERESGSGVKGEA